MWTWRAIIDCDWVVFSLAHTGRCRRFQILRDHQQIRCNTVTGARDSGRRLVREYSFRSMRTVNRHMCIQCYSPCGQVERQSAGTLIVLLERDAD